MTGTISDGRQQANPEGDGALFARELYARHRKPLMRLAVYLTGGDLHRAEDLVQETIVRAWSRRHGIRSGEERSWLAATARNLAIDAHRRLVHREARERATVHSSPTLDSDFAEHVATKLAVRAAVAALPPHHRAVVARVYLAGWSVDETAVSLGIPPGTVKSRTFHAMAAASGHAKMRVCGQLAPGSRPSFLQFCGHLWSGWLGLFSAGSRRVVMQAVPPVWMGLR